MNLQYRLFENVTQSLEWKRRLVSEHILTAELGSELCYLGGKGQNLG